MRLVMGMAMVMESFNVVCHSPQPGVLVMRVLQSRGHRERRLRLNDTIAYCVLPREMAKGMMTTILTHLILPRLVMVMVRCG